MGLTRREEAGESAPHESAARHESAAQHESAAPSWTDDGSWQYGHDPHQAVYVLEGRFADPADVRRAAALASTDPRTAGFGGVSLAAEDGALALASSGEDALDSLEDAVVRVEGVLRGAGLPMPVWHRRPPRVDGGAVELEWHDGYWIRPGTAADVVARRERLAAELAEAGAARLVDGLHWGVESGVLVLRGRAHGGDEVFLRVGPEHLDMIEQALADGEGEEYLFG